MESAQTPLQLSSHSSKVASCLLFSMSLPWSPSSIGLERRRQIRPFSILFASQYRARVSIFADDITVFVSCHLDIQAVKKVAAKYKQVAGAKVNFDKSGGLQLGACLGSVSLPGSFC